VKLFSSTCCLINNPTVGHCFRQLRLIKSCIKLFSFEAAGHLLTVSLFQELTTAAVYWQAYQMSPRSTAVSSKCVSQAAMWLSEIWPRHATDTRSTSLAPRFTVHWVQTVSADVQITSWNGTLIPCWSLLFVIRGRNLTQPSVCDKRWPSCSQDVHQVGHFLSQVHVHGTSFPLTYVLVTL